MIHVDPCLRQNLSGESPYRPWEDAGFCSFELNYDITDFFGLFIRSGVAARFEQGDFTLLVGLSGVELAYEVLEQSGITVQRIKPKYTIDRSAEYWTGWALAYYQWETSLPFAEITRYIPIHDIQALYSPTTRWISGSSVTK